MIYNTPVYFQKVIVGEYDAETGDYGHDTVEEVMKWADISDAGDNTVQFVYGEARSDVVVVRLQHRYGEPFDFIRIGSKRYHADRIRSGLIGQAFVCSEVQ